MPIVTRNNVSAYGNALRVGNVNPVSVITPIQQTGRIGTDKIPSNIVLGGPNTIDLNPTGVVTRNDVAFKSVINSIAIGSDSIEHRT